MSNTERLYFVIYDISGPKRWRRVFRIMQGYGEWLQLSVFQCRLSPIRRAELVADLEKVINNEEDHVLIVDIGPESTVKPKVVSLGKQGFSPVEREPLII